MTTSLQLYRYSFTAGAFAAGGSFFGRAPSQLSELPALASVLAPTAAATYYLELLFLRALPIILMVICNVLNWRYYLKALQCAEQTLTATVLTAATNYMLSFVLGALIYREEITLLSTAGATFIIGGLWFLCKAQEEQKISDKLKKIE
ncbi:uncharacterized protein LOC105215167 [Zeugodacus cucurbitae]|uniref:Probable 4-amino-4-deoxy-L-arabinose-phosphoundecaprenol flippase subunit ArnF n=1 Tax=Zeugodacus cucurbitae TaxID=28588 RepID=A0A0A1WTY8_ZEUCU|nr:uncharacterized protein LOC105215167 [Zeugodacus cucurbitae]